MPFAVFVHTFSQLSTPALSLMSWSDCNGPAFLIFVLLVGSHAAFGLTSIRVHYVLTACGDKYKYIKTSHGQPCFSSWEYDFFRSLK